jgi:hypothetical protein
MSMHYMLTFQNFWKKAKIAEAEAELVKAFKMIQRRREQGEEGEGHERVGRRCMEECLRSVGVTGASAKVEVLKS